MESIVNFLTTSFQNSHCFVFMALDIFRKYLKRVKRDCLKFSHKLTHDHFMIYNSLYFPLFKSKE